MLQGTFAFFIMVFGKTIGVHLEILERQKKRLKLQQVSLVDTSNVVLAFVPIVSRAGTDIAAALEKIPTHRPVVLIVIHNTFDPDCIVPDSNLHVKQFNNVLAVDFLYFEETGLLLCQKNDISAKAITDHLISLGASARDMPAPSPMPSWITANYKMICFCFCIVIALGLIIVITTFLIEKFMS